MATTLEKMLPSGKSYRELWMAQDIWSPDGTTYYCPPSAKGGHRLTLMNQAAKRTTVDGLMFHGAATDNLVVAADAVLNNQAAFWVCIRFKFNLTFSIASTADQYLMNKALAADDYIRLRFESDDGKLYFEQGNEAAGQEFQLASTTASWAAGTWYTVIANFNAVPVQRLLVNGTAEDTDTVATPIATPAGADLIIGSSSDGGADGFQGVISWVVVGTDTLDTGEESLLYKGFPPADAVNEYLLNEGKGTTAYCRGSGVDNGTIDTGCDWNYGVKQSCLSFDGINDYAVSASGGIIGREGSFIWAGKLKSTYLALNAAKNFARVYVDASNLIDFYASTGGGGLISALVYGSGAGTAVGYTPTHSIGDYSIFVTAWSGADMEFFANGISKGSVSDVGDISGGAVTTYIGRPATATNYDVSAPILVGLVNGALTDKEALKLSIDLNKWLGLGITI